MWHCNLQHDHSSNYCWNRDINLLIKGKLRVNCQQWKALDMDNELQTWFHLLLLVSAVCTTWLHFWVDKNTELKTGSNHTCMVPLMNIFIISQDVRQCLTYPSYPSHVDSQTDISPWHMTPQTNCSCPGPAWALSWLFWSPLGFNTHHLYDNCGVQFKPMETVGQAVLQYLLGSFWNMKTKAHIHFSVEGTGP